MSICFNRCSAPWGVMADLDGEQRIFADIVDMGADEVVTNPVDLNNDGVVDYLEMSEVKR